MSVSIQTDESQESTEEVTTTVEPELDPSTATPSAPEIITYGKSIQTDDDNDKIDPDDEQVLISKLEKELRKKLELEFEEKYATLLQQGTKQVIDQKTTVNNIPTTDKNIDGTDDKIETHDPNLLNNESFIQFIDKSLKVVERAIEDDYDVLTDYNSVFNNLNQSDEPTHDTNFILKQSSQLYSPKWSHLRSITDIDWSIKYPELILASYNHAKHAISEPKGIIQVWNQHMKGKPEYVFTAETDILSACFAINQPQIIFGGGYSGQIFAWDMRLDNNNSHGPILRSPLNEECHTHPVFTLANINLSSTATTNTNANGIITASTDGTVCAWASDLLAKPQESLHLKAIPPTLYDDLAPVTIDIMNNDSNCFLFGAEDGNIYQCNRFDQAGARAGVDWRGIYKGHMGPVNRITFHPNNNYINNIANYSFNSSSSSDQFRSKYNDLMLSCGYDWTIKLWKTSHFNSDAFRSNGITSDLNTSTRLSDLSASLLGQSGPTGATVKSQTISPLMQFYRDDTVFDVSWHPQLPGVWSCVDGSGNVEIWDLLKDSEMPMFSTKPNYSSLSSSSGPTTTSQEPSIESRKALNKLRWETQTGNKLAVGGENGVLTIFDVNLNELSTPSVDNWQKLDGVLNQEQYLESF